MKRRAVLQSIVALLLAPIAAFGRHVTKAALPVELPAPPPGAPAMYVEYVRKADHMTAATLGGEHMLVKIKGTSEQLQSFVDVYTRVWLPEAKPDATMYYLTWHHPKKCLYLILPLSVTQPMHPVTCAAITAIEETKCVIDPRVEYELLASRLLLCYDHGAPQ